MKLIVVIVFSLLLLSCASKPLKPIPYTKEIPAYPCWRLINEISIIENNIVVSKQILEGEYSVRKGNIDSASVGMPTYTRTRIPEARKEVEFYLGVRGS
ncbi:MAG TPA: hypothetical protein PLB54_04445 [Nitrosomonas sp.]|nr:hypothetical protein [Nitrosomonas sp.]